MSYGKDYDDDEEKECNYATMDASMPFTTAKELPHLMKQELETFVRATVWKSMKNYDKIADVRNAGIVNILFQQMKWTKNNVEHELLRRKHYLAFGDLVIKKLGGLRHAAIKAMKRAAFGTYVCKEYIMR